MRTTTRLRELLAASGIIPAPGAYDCLSADTGYGDVLQVRRTVSGYSRM